MQNLLGIVVFLFTRIFNLIFYHTVLGSHQNKYKRMYYSVDVNGPNLVIYKI